MLLEDCHETEVRKASEVQKGDWRPLIFLMTDGQPTDDWEEAAARIKQKKVGNIIACAAGGGADSRVLKNLTETVVELQNLEPDALKAFFKWVSGSIKTTSQGLAQVTPDAPGLDRPPRRGPRARGPDGRRPARPEDATWWTRNRTERPPLNPTTPPPTTPRRARRPGRPPSPRPAWANGSTSPSPTGRTPTRSRSVS